MSHLQTERSWPPWTGSRPRISQPQNAHAKEASLDSTAPPPKPGHVLASLVDSSVEASQQGDRIHDFRSAWQSQGRVAQPRFGVVGDERHHSFNLNLHHKPTTFARDHASCRSSHRGPLGTWSSLVSDWMFLANGIPIDAGMRPSGKGPSRHGPTCAGSTEATCRRRPLTATDHAIVLTCTCRLSCMLAGTCEPIVSHPACLH